MPTLSWLTIAIGDPLYRPFAISFAQQWAERDKLPDALYPYVVLRELQRLQNQHADDEARQVATDSMRARASAPVALAQAKLEAKAGRHAEACRAAAWVTRMTDFPATQLPWAIEAAQDLLENGQAAAALEFLKKRIEDPGLPEEFRIDFLTHGVAAAKAAHDETLGKKWSGELETLQALGKEKEKEKKK